MCLLVYVLEYWHVKHCCRLHRIVCTAQHLYTKMKIQDELWDIFIFGLSITQIMNNIMAATKRILTKRVKTYLLLTGSIRDNMFVRDSVFILLFLMCIYEWYVGWNECAWKFANSCACVFVYMYVLLV